MKTIFAAIVAYMQRLEEYRVGQIVRTRGWE
jgi:hypothetical protein